MNPLWNPVSKTGFASGFPKSQICVGKQQKAFADTPEIVSLGTEPELFS